MLGALVYPRCPSLSGAAVSELFVPADVRRVPHEDETDAVTARRTTREGLAGHARDVVITRVSSIMMDGVDSRFFDFIARFPRIDHSRRNLIIVSSARSYDFINSQTTAVILRKKRGMVSAIADFGIAAASTVSPTRPRIASDEHRMLCCVLVSPGA